ncbi:hypothetical protein M8C13_02480 [Crossiella sp. SN42]|uniref:hypothetical protein n=1 Tax=Crossiella sp. SN42 TaxID=2944808 RepID=UPI00207D3064|nr:hypothetical protein [Crossiella sp. SN42]MCO1574624.1 hypothetical protein [Crossiella sp. SN42]
MPAPPDKPFATPPGGQAQPAITAYGALLGGMALAAPVLLVALLVPGGSWLALPLGVVWAGLAAEAGAALGAEPPPTSSPRVPTLIPPPEPEIGPRQLRCRGRAVLCPPK